MAASADRPAGPWIDLRTTIRDGLRLYGRHYPAPASHRRPVLCLPGLTRNSRDFDWLARFLSSGETARSVYTLDYRGRGHSDHAGDWKSYAIPIETLDVQDVMAAHGLHGAAIVGTSRGGLIAMVLAAAQPGAVGPVVLNDIGPVIERDGLARIAGYVGRTPLPRSWPEAADLVAAMSRRAFPGVPESEWAEVARQLFNERGGRPAPGYDPKLGNTLSVTDAAPPALWPQFMALARVPVLVIRGETSDILSAATVAEMRERHPRCAAFEVPGQGHAPLLRDTPTCTAIAGFLAATDAEAGLELPGASQAAA